MNVNEIMTKNIHTLPPSASVWDAANLIDLQDVRHIPIVENEVLCGIVSERDVLRCSLPYEEAKKNRQGALACFDKSVREIMQDEVFTLPPDASIARAVSLLIDGRFGLIPIVDSKTARLLGVVSYIDLLKTMHASLTGEENVNEL